MAGRRVVAFPLRSWSIHGLSASQSITSSFRCLFLLPPLSTPLTIPNPVLSHQVADAPENWGPVLSSIREFPLSLPSRYLQLLHECGFCSLVSLKIFGLMSSILSLPVLGSPVLHNREIPALLPEAWQAV